MAKILDKLKEKDSFTIEDSHDIEQHILDIHSTDISQVLSNDLILGLLDEKEKKYVAEQIVLAHEAKYLIKDSRYRDYAVSRLLLKGIMVVILNRNIKNNPILELLLKKKDEILPAPESQIDDKILSKLDQDKRGVK